MNVDEIKNIMDVCYSSIKNKEIFDTDSTLFIKKHVKEEGQILVAQDADVIVAYLLVRFPELHKDNLGYDLNYGKKDLSQVAHIESVGVLPQYRGRGLQHKLIELAEKKFKASHSHFLATVSPYNKYSLQNFLDLGYKIKKRKLKYGGKERYIVEKSF